MFANFSWFWKHKFQTLISLVVQKNVNQKRSAFSQYWGLNFDPPLCSSPFHHSSSVIYSMLNRCKKSYFINHSSCICHPFIYGIINLLCVSHVQCVMSYLFKQQQVRVMVHSRLFIWCLFNQGLMCDICRSSYHPLHV